jgi:ankyrin repeat protein
MAWATNWSRETILQNHDNWRGRIWQHEVIQIMKTKLGVLIFLLAAALAQAQTNSLTALLQQGLFEEQANQNLDAAIADYSSLAKQFDKDRQLAATAVFRIGECYRMQSRTNEAAEQYERILRDFSDQTTLATLSRQNLTGMGMAEPSSTASPSAAALTQQKELLGEEIKLVEQQLASQQAQVKLGTLPSDGVLPTQQKLLELKRQLAALDSNRAELLDLSVPTTSEEDQEIARIQQMIQDSPDLINAPAADGSTFLAEAAYKGQLKVAAYLLDHGADVNAGPALNSAALAGNRTMVEFLLSRGANVNSKSGTGTSGATSLGIAVEKNYPSVIDVLLANKADVNAPDNLGNTPLLTAARHGQVKIVQTLLAAGANLNMETDQGRTLLSFAAVSGSPETVKLLLDAKADPNGGVLDAPLLVAIHNNDVESAELLLQSGANSNKKSFVDWAISFNNTTYYQGNSVTPLFLAVSTKQLPMVQLLLKFKADPNDSQTEGEPLLFRALDNPDILEALLAAGGKVDSRTSTGYHLLEYAIGDNNAASLEILLKHGANPNASSFQGDTPLHYAARKTVDAKFFELLFDYKADPNVRNDYGRTPLDLLKDHLGQPSLDTAAKVAINELIDLLHQHGALDKLPDWDRITVSRSSENFSRAVFQKDTNDWNQFSLLELIGSIDNSYNYNGPNNLLAFADLAHIIVIRPSTTGATAKRIEVNLLNSTNGVDCTKDIPLKFGDVVEIPEREHTLAESAVYLSNDQSTTILNYFRRRSGAAKLIVAGGQTIRLPLQAFYSQIGYVLHGAAAQSVLTSSSDLAHIKVTRHDATTGKNHEWIMDCSDRQNSSSQFISQPTFIYRQAELMNNANSTQPTTDLWLRDGDVIEVPEKP